MKADQPESATSRPPEVAGRRTGVANGIEEPDTGPGQEVDRLTIVETHHPQRPTMGSPPPVQSGRLDQPDHRPRHEGPPEPASSHLLRLPFTMAIRR